MATKTIGSGQVGRSVRRLEGAAKVTGHAEYVHNLRMPGMLYGKIVRSTVAHGRIRSIDVEAARALAGVHRVVTIADIRTVVPEPVDLTWTRSHNWFTIHRPRPLCPSVSGWIRPTRGFSR